MSGIRGHAVSVPRWLSFALVACAAYPLSAGAAELNVRLTVSEAGPHRVAYADLPGPAPVASERLHLYNRGREVAVWIEDGGDGQFGPGDSLVFYGLPVRPGDPEYKYTEGNVYWLKTEDGTPLRMAQWSGEAAEAAASFRDVRRFEQNWAYWQQMPDGVGEDHWFWGGAIMAGASRDFEVTLDTPAPGGAAATVRLALHGATDIVSSPDHHTELRLNGHSLGSFLWDGQTPKVQEFANMPAAWLKDGANVFTVAELSDLGIDVDSVYVNWFEVEYDRTFTARDD